MTIKNLTTRACLLPIAVLISGCTPAQVSETDQKLIASPVENRNSHAESLQVREGASEKTHPASKKKAPQPIDLANALAMGGANNLEIELARKRVIKAHIDYADARANWLPSLRFGVGYNKHNGQIQSTPGPLIDANRNSLFVGGGAGLGDASLAGGSGGPSRLVMNMSLADAFFKPIIARRGVESNSAAERVTMNDSLLQISLSYFDLVEAYSLLANARVGRLSSQKMLTTSTAFERQGLESPAEIQRAKTDLAVWKQKVMDAERKTGVASAELTRLLRLDPTTRLYPADERMVPVMVVKSNLSLDELIKQGLANRPELTEQDARIAASQHQLSREKYDLLLPHVQAGMSTGNFGGGVSSQYNNSSSRNDLDLLAVWELKNLGQSQKNAKKRRTIELEQAKIKSKWLADKIASEIVIAHNDIESYRDQVEVARKSVKSASESYQSNVLRIQQDKGQPLELLQAIHAQSEALDLYTKAIANYNRAQFKMLHALGSQPCL